MVISSIRHIGIVVKDLNRSLKFYSDLLELKTYMNITETGTFIENLTGIDNVKVEWIKLIIPKGGLIELLQYHSHPDNTILPENKGFLSNKYGYSHVALTVDDLSKLYIKMTQLGYTSKSEPLISPNGKVKILNCHDPDGNILELIEDL